MRSITVSLLATAMATAPQQMMCLVGTPEQVAQVLRGLGFVWPGGSNAAADVGSYCAGDAGTSQPAAATHGASSGASRECFDIGDQQLPGDAREEKQFDEQYDALGVLGCEDALEKDMLDEHSCSTLASSLGRHLS